MRLLPAAPRRLRPRRLLLSLAALLVLFGAARSAGADKIGGKRILRHFPNAAVCPFRGQYDLWFVATTGQATIIFDELVNDGQPLQIDRIYVAQIDEAVFAENFRADPNDADCWDTLGDAPRFDPLLANGPVVFTDLFDSNSGWSLTNAQVAGGFLQLGPGTPARAARTITGLVPGKRYYVLGWSTDWADAGEGVTVTVDAPRPAAFFLQNGRFRLEVRYGPSQQLAGGEVLTAKSAAFWFGDPAKVELIVNLAERCAIDGRFWLMVGGTTSALARVTVIDTATGRRVTYQNPKNVVFQTRIDKTTFRCP